MREPKIVIYDLETLPIQCFTWSLFKPMIPIEAIIQDSAVICGSYKYLGEKEVHTISIGDNKAKFEKNPYDDKQVIKKLQKVIADADIVVAHNGDSFDAKVLQGRIIKHGLPPLDIQQSVDTLKEIRKVARITSNKLDYLGEFLGVGRKIPTSYSLWTGIANGDAKCLDKMEKYNVQDVLLLEDVYNKLRPYMKKHPNMGLFDGSDAQACPKCGSHNVIKSGTRKTNTMVYQRYQCQDCGSWSKGKTAVRSVDLR